MQRILIMLVMLFFVNCNNYSNIISDKFEMIIYKKSHEGTNKDIQLLKLNTNDIESVDWQNQSFKIKNDKTKPVLGFLGEYMKMFFNGKEIAHINILNVGTSNRYICESRIFTFVFHTGIFSKDNWLVIIPFKDSEGKTVHKELYNSELYYFLMNKGKLTSTNWKYTPGIKVANAPNIHFCKRLPIFFESEILPNWEFEKLLKYHQSVAFNCK